MQIQLKYPFTTPAGQSISTLSLRRLKVKDLKDIGEKAGNNEVLLEMLGVARMCKLIPEDLEEMDAVDYQKVKARFLEYVGVTPESATGDGAAGAVVPLPAE